MAIRPRLTGIKEAVRAFKALPEAAQEHLGEATEKTAFAVAQRAKALVRVLTGALKNAIGSSYAKRTGVARAGVEKGQRNRLTPSKYAHLVEFGHGGPHPAPAHPFMIPAAEAERQPYLERCREAGKKIERDLSVSRFE